MNKWSAVFLYGFSGLIAAISQLLMKLEAKRNIGESGIRRILHLRVIVAYGLMFGTILINMVAMRYVPYKYAPVLGTFSYIFVLLLGYFGLKERIGKRKALGACVILLGIIIFNQG
ncbi:MAG: EamA family transporter [Lachnospiraceae bacterium]|nr:EamA family transporter [Lachnospiraceae bacterium]